MLPPVTIQRGTLAPLPHSVGSLLVCRYNGKDVLCVKTYINLIDLELPTQYFGTLQCQMKTSKFEITKEIIAVDGKMASFRIKCKGKYGLKKYLLSIAPHEGRLCNDSDAYIITERGESITAYPVRFRPLEVKNRLGVYLERGMMEELPKGCPIYNKENKVIGLIKCKNYGILWFVSWFYESTLFKKCDIACIEEFPEKDEENEAYQSIGNFNGQLEKECNSYSNLEIYPPQKQVSQSIKDSSDFDATSIGCIPFTDGANNESVAESDMITADGVADILNYAEPVTLESRCHVRKVQKAEDPPHFDVVKDLKQQVESMKKQLDILSKRLERAQMSTIGAADTVDSESRADNRGYTRICDKPSSMETPERENEAEKNAVESYTTYEDLKIDGKVTRSPYNRKRAFCNYFSTCSVPNEYVRNDTLHIPMPQDANFPRGDLGTNQRCDDFSLGTTINDIDQETLFELANELDDKDWERFASQIGVSEEIIQQIKLHQIGRSFSAIEFMVNFTTRFPRERLIDFRKNVIAIQRNDVVDYIDTTLAAEIMSTIQEIPSQKLEALASRLEMSQFKSIKYWRHLAGLYGYENQSINAIESTFSHQDRSPTLALFDYMGKSTPHTSVLDIGRALEKLGLLRISKKLHGLLLRRMTCASLPNLLQRDLLQM